MTQRGGPDVSLEQTSVGVVESSSPVFREESVAGEGDAHWGSFAGQGAARTQIGAEAWPITPSVSLQHNRLFSDIVCIARIDKGLAIQPDLFAC